MQMMSAGLETAAGNRMKQILEKLTASRFLGVLVGAAITAVIQSSSATTVMVVGFVNSRMMTLTQAVWIIMGANIGTTVTGLLIALDVGVLALLIAFAGVVLIVFFKNPKLHPPSVKSWRPWRTVHRYGYDERRYGSPAGFPGIYQPDDPLFQPSAGDLGRRCFYSNHPVILRFGGNSANTGRQRADRPSQRCLCPVWPKYRHLYHGSTGLYRNQPQRETDHGYPSHVQSFGTALFTLLCQTTPLTGFLQSLAPASPSAQIALTHTMFNIVTTMVLLPFGNWMVKAAIRILPDSKKGKRAFAASEIHHPIRPFFGSAYWFFCHPSDTVGDGTGADAVHGSGKCSAAFHAVLQRDDSSAGKVTEREDYLDYLNKEISQFISRIIVLETNEGPLPLSAPILKSAAILSGLATMP